MNVIQTQLSVNILIRVMSRDLNWKSSIFLCAKNVKTVVIIIRNQYEKAIVVKIFDFFIVKTKVLVEV